MYRSAECISCFIVFCVCNTCLKSKKIKQYFWTFQCLNVRKHLAGLFLAEKWRLWVDYMFKCDQSAHSKSRDSGLAYLTEICIFLVFLMTKERLLDK